MHHLVAILVTDETNPAIATRCVASELYHVAVILGHGHRGVQYTPTKTCSALFLAVQCPSLVLAPIPANSKSLILREEMRVFGLHMRPYFEALQAIINIAWRSRIGIQSLQQPRNHR